MELNTCLGEFNKNYPRPGIDPLKLSELYDLQTDWPSKKWPNSEAHGVYVVLSEDQSVLYIGKASCNHTIGQRLGAHFCKGKSGEAKCTHESWSAVRYVCTIGVQEGHAFEAPALEEYLISKVDPPMNSLGKQENKT